MIVHNRGTIIHKIIVQNDCTSAGKTQ